MKVNKGHCRKLGATIEGSGVNFALWARLASRVELLLFASETDDNPTVIRLSPLENRTAYYWHLFVDNIGDG